MVPVVLKASIAEAPALASKVISNTGRRPMRSERLPQMGAPTNCPKE